MSEHNTSESKENFETRDKSMPSSDTIERTVLSQYNFNYSVGGNDAYDVSSQLVIDEAYSSSQSEQAQKSENIIFPEQDMSVYECSQPESDVNTITCPNRVIFSSEVMDFVNSQNSCDNDDIVVDENEKKSIECDDDVDVDVDDDVDRMVTEVNGNISDGAKCNRWGLDGTENGRVEPPHDLSQSLDKAESDSIVADADMKQDDISSEFVQAIDLTIATDDSEPAVRSLTPCLDEKSESETGEISDSNDNCPLPIILSKNVLNKIQIENGMASEALAVPVVTCAVAASTAASAAVSAVASAAASVSVSTNFNENAPAAHSESFRSTSLLHFPSPHSYTSETDKESIHFKKVNKSTKERNYRDQFCNGNSLVSKQPQAPSLDAPSRSRPRLEFESLSAIKRHLAPDIGLSATKNKRKPHRHDEEVSIEKHQKPSHKKLKKPASSSSSSSKRHRRSLSRISNVSRSSSASSSSRLSSTIPVHFSSSFRAPDSSGSITGTSGFVGGSSSGRYTPPIKHNIKVIVSNDRVQKKSTNKNDDKKSGRRQKSASHRRKRRRHLSSPAIGSSFITQLPQSKKVYSTGNNILVSLTVDPKTTSTMKTNPSVMEEDVKPVISPNMKVDSEGNPKVPKHSKHLKKKKKKPKKAKKVKKVKKSKKSSSKHTTDSTRKSVEGNTSPKLSSSRILNTNIDALKTLAIFDLEQSPVRELTPEPVPVIEISDSDEPGCEKRTSRKNGSGSGNSAQQASANQSSRKHRLASAKKANASVDKDQKAEKKMSETAALESELEHRLNQALCRFPMSSINTATTTSSAAVVEPSPDATNKNSSTLATTPRSPDVYDPFEPTSSPVSSSSLNFYKSSSRNNEQQSSVTKNTSSLSNHPTDLNKNSSFSSDDVPSNHNSNSHANDVKSPHKLHHSNDSSGNVDDCGGGRVTNSTSEPHDSPYSPGISDFDDVYDPEAAKQVDKIKLAEQIQSVKGVQNAAAAGLSASALKVTTANSNFNSNNHFSSTKPLNTSRSVAPVASNSAGLRLSEENLRMLGQMPNAANAKDNSAHDYVNKLNRQERVVEEVKFVLKPEYSKKKITKEQYKEILRKAVPKILHNRSGVINPIKIRTLILAYVKKYHYINKHGVPMCDTKSDN